ncbi:MAG: T9SS type A sorting domain-containing protein [Flavobacteriia bacterium]|nr:T9SS type A sorting domain-containing protein [Flavobacteriia bacterium]
MQITNAIKRWCLLVLIGMFTGPALMGQAYVPSYTEAGGYPGTANTLSNSSTSGWTEIIPQSLSANQWSGPIAIPFAFDFYGSPVTELQASGNGLVTFLSNPGTTPPDPATASSPTLSDANMPDSTIAAYWAEFPTGGTNSGDRVYTQTFGTAPNRQFWVKWHSYAWGAGGDFWYGAVVLEESTNKIYVMGLYGAAGLDNLPTAVGIRVDASNQFELNNPTNPGSLGSGTTDDNRYDFEYFSTNCIPPVVTSVTPGITSATINTALFGTVSGIEVEFGAPGFTQGSGTMASNTGGSVVLSPLSAETDYEYYVRGDCGSGTFTTWEGPFTFTTLRPAIATFPFIENFDSTSVWSGTDVDSLWSQRSDDGTDWDVNSGATTSSSTGPDGDLTGGQYLYIEYTGASSGDRAVLETPVFDVTSLTSPYLTFFYHRYGAAMGDMEVEYSTDFGDTWTSGLLYTGQVQTSSSDNWLQADVALPSSPNVQLRFIGTVGSSFTTDMAIDSVRVGEEPCLSPGSITVEPALSSTELTVNWTSNTGSFRVEWGVTGFDQSTGTSNTALVTNDSTFTITGLFRNTEYDIYVYGDCSSSGQGTTLIPSPVQGFTLPSVPYLETFDNGYLPDDRWGEKAGVLANPTSFVSETSSGWLEDEWLNVASSPDQSARLFVGTTSSSASQDDWFFTPLLDLGAGGQYEIAFSAGLTENAGIGAAALEADDTLFVVVSTDTGQTWNRSDAIYKIHSGNAPTNSGDLYRIDMSSFTGIVQVGFYLESTVQNAQSYNFFINDFRLRDIPACPTPTGFNVSGISDTAVGVTWDNIPDASSYVVYLTPQDSSYFLPGTVTDTVTGDSTYFSGLMPNTGYDLYIESLCSGSNSVINGPLTFRTNCVPVFTAPFVFDFEGLSEGPAVGSNFDNCLSSDVVSSYEWEIDLSTGSNTHSSNTGPVFDNTLFPVSGGSFIYTEASSGSTDDTARFSTPLMDVSALTTPGLTFAYHMYGDDMGTLQIDVSTDGVNWQNGFFRITGPQQTDETDPWDSLSLDLSFLNSDTVAVRFTGIRGSGFESDMAIDDIRFDEYTASACPVPTSFVLSNITGTSVDASWMSSNTSVTIAVSSSNDPNDSANTTYYSGLTGTSLALTGLTPNACYTAYIQGNCTADSTGWLNATPFCTPCLSIYNAPLSLDFQSETVGFDDAGALQSCWTFVQGTSDPVWTVQESDGANQNSSGTGPLWDNTQFGVNGGNYIYLETSSAGTGDTAIFESPWIDVSALTGVPAIEFFYHMYGGDMGNLYVQYMEPNGSWMTVDSIVGEQQTDEADPWIQRITLLSSLNSDTVAIRFIGQAGTGFESDMALDDVGVIDAPSCLPPGNLAISNITTSGADIAWTTSADSVTIAVSTSNDPDDSTSTFYVTNLTGTSTTLSLDPATCYDVYIRSMCTSDTSLWAPVGEVCTPCPPFYAAPYGPVEFESETDGFDDAGPLTNCWAFVQGTSDPVWEVEVSDGSNKNSSNTGPWFDNTSFGVAGGQYIFMETSSADEGDTAIVESPDIYVGGLTNRPQVSFYYHMYGADMGTLYVNARNKGGAWVTVDSIVGQQQTAGGDAWIKRESVIDGLNDTIQIRFVGVAGSDFESDMSLDDISVEEAPSCPDPQGLDFSNITNTSVDLNWNTFNPSATVLVEYGPEGFNLGSGNSATLTSNPGTLSGLSQGTCYDVYLREVCSAGDSTAWIGPISFCTTFTCGPVAGSGIPSDTAICAPGTLTLAGNSNDMYWENVNGEIYYSGSPFETDSIDGDTAFYARGYDVQYSRRFGPKTDIATTGFGNFSNGEMITVLNEVRIDTVTLKSDGARSGTIRFWKPLAGFSNNYDDADIDTILELQQEVDWSLSAAGEFRVPVGVALKPGRYFVNLSFDTTGTGELFRATSGAQYPYELANIMSIDSAVGVSNFPEVRVYYLFDWTVSALCSSPLDTSNVEFAPEVTASFTENSASGSATATEYDVFFDATGSTNGVDYEWDFGDGSVSSGPNDTITHSYIQNGVYTVTLITTGICGDTDTATTTITIQGISVEEVSFNGEVRVYPNPTSGVVTINIETLTNSEATIQLASLSGQVLFTENLDANTSWIEQMDISELPAGTYVLSIKTADGIHIERVIRQ